MMLRSLLVLAILFSCLPAAGQQYVYVSYSNTHSVKRYDYQTGAYIDDIIPGDATRRRETQEVLFGKDGMLYVSFWKGPDSASVHRYDPLTGQDLGRFTTGYELDEPTKMSWGPDGHLYVSQWGATRWNVAVFDGDTGAFLRLATNEPSKLNLMDHTWDADGNLFVVAFGSASGGRDVRRYNAAGTYMGSLVSQGILVGPVNLWFEPDGDLMVLDWGNQNGSGRVLRFNGTTGLLKQTVVSGLVHVEGYAVDDAGRLWVGDWGANYVYRYDNETGTFMDRFIKTGGLITPNSIAFGPPEPLGTDTVLEEQPMAFRLDQNYPNPFNPSTQIAFSLERDAAVTLVVYDMMGREVARLAEGRVLPAGSHTFRFDAGSLPSGSYLYRLSANGRTETRTMFLLK
ncbi:MAG: T9SS type A sorting domain-containing protein [Bacteroidetes bacterium]|nr:T9SS type A sorting domain-containing protein [Bacteroidota bacterium]